MISAIFISTLYPLRMHLRLSQWMLSKAAELDEKSAITYTALLCFTSTSFAESSPSLSQLYIHCFRNLLHDTLCQNLAWYLQECYALLVVAVTVSFFLGNFNNVFFCFCFCLIVWHFLSFPDCCEQGLKDVCCKPRVYL